MIRSTSMIAVLAAVALSSGSAHAAGYVEAKFKKGNLILKGDYQRNVITVDKSGSYLRIRGHEGTLINGSAEVFSVLPEDIKVKLNGGDDYIYFNTIAVDDLKINTSDGDDTVVIYNCEINDDLKVNTGDDDDSVYVTNTEIGDDLSVKLGEDDDYFQVMGSETYDKSKVRCSDGNDRAYVHSSYFADEAEIDMGDNNDELEVLGGTYFDDDAELDGGDNYDYLYIPSDAGDDVDVDDFENVDD